jgi:hypothetical protein
MIVYRIIIKNGRLGWVIRFFCVAPFARNIAQVSAEAKLVLTMPNVADILSERKKRNMQS